MYHCNTKQGACLHPVLRSPYLTIFLIADIHVNFTRNTLDTACIRILPHGDGTSSGISMSRFQTSPSGNPDMGISQHASINLVIQPVLICIQCKCISGFLYFFLECENNLCTAGICRSSLQNTGILEVHDNRVIQFSSIQCVN